MNTATFRRTTLLMDRVTTNLLKPIAIASALFLTLLAPYSSADPLNAKETIKAKFWGELYRDGGETYYCGKAFSKQNPLIAASYIYPQGSIRQHLNCGSKRQCIRDSAEYNRIASDLYNIVPADSYFEMKRTDTVFGILDDSIKANDCGLRRKLHVIEPPAHLKGDIARVIFYMHEQYDLPIIGNRADLEIWAENDPVSDEERERLRKISEIQEHNSITNDTLALNGGSAAKGFVN